MRLKEIIRPLYDMKVFKFVEFKGYGFYETSELNENVVEQCESGELGEIFVDYFEGRNNIVSIYGLFKDLVR